MRNSFSLVLVSLTRGAFLRRPRSCETTGVQRQTDRKEEAKSKKIDGRTKRTDGRVSGHTQIRETIEARASSPSSCERRGTHHRLSKRPVVSEQNIVVVIVSSGAEFPQGSTNYPIPHLASQEFGMDRSSAEKNREIRNTNTTWTENARTRERESNRFERFF